jgi:hypothetical protein
MPAKVCLKEFLGFDCMASDFLLVRLAATWLRRSKRGVHSWLRSLWLFQVNQQFGEFIQSTLGGLHIGFDA